MLYKFKSKVTGDVIMLEPNGRRILEIIGKVPDRQGIIQSHQMAAAIAALEAAIVQEQSAKQAALLNADASATAAPPGTGHDEVISLRQRATPMLDMLRRCQAADKEIVWGV